MHLQCECIKDKLFASVKGELDMSVAARFRTQLDQEIGSRQVRHLILDFSGVTFIDSSGLGVILGRYKKLAEIGGTVKICSAHPQVLRILELSGLTRIMDVEHDDLMEDEEEQGVGHERPGD